MAIINPYLNFHGTAEEAFNLYKSVFGGEFASILRFRDTPEAERVPLHERDKIMHISLPIGKGNVLMATDALESMGHNITVGTNTHISVSVDSEQEADRIFKGLSAGGKVVMSMENTFWGSYFGMLTDRFGIQWMVSYDKNQNI